MGKETQTVEVFSCPTCGAAQFIEWDPGEMSRSIACTTCFVEGREDVEMMGEKGAPIVVTRTWNKGNWLDCHRGSGVEFQERQVDHDLGREASWQTTKTGLSDPGVDMVLNNAKAVTDG